MTSLEEVFEFSDLSDNSLPTDNFWRKISTKHDWTAADTSSDNKVIQDMEFSLVSPFGTYS